jgi:AsmA protein
VNRPLKFVLIGLGAIVLLAATAVAVVLMTFDPNRYKPDIEAAVQQATGRTLTINGKIGVAVSMTPTLRATDVSFANPTGYSRPQMASLQSLDLQIALLPLISRRLHIDKLILKQPDILLEVDANGHPNWIMSPPPPSGAAAPTPPPTTTTQPAEPGHPLDVSVGSIRIENGNFAYRDDRTNKTLTLGVKSADMTSGQGAMYIELAATYASQDFQLTADTGSIAGLQTGDAAWPVNATLSSAGAKITAKGTVGLATQAYDLAVTGSIPDSAVFAPLLPATKLPVAHDVTFTTNLKSPGGATLPTLSTLTLHTGAAALDDVAPNLTITSLDVKAPTLDQPMQIVLNGSRGGTAFALSGSAGGIGQLVPGTQPQPTPVNLTLTVADATLSVSGTINDQATLSGVQLAVKGQIPDLMALSPLAGQNLPALKQIGLQATLTDGTGGLRNAIKLTGVTLTGPDADLTGDIAVTLTPKLTIVTTVTSKHIDLDALQTTTKAAPPNQPSTTPGAAPAPSPVVHRDNRIFPDTPLPFDLLKQANADIGLSVAVLHASSADVKSLTVHATLTDGKLTIDKLSASLPEGAMSGTTIINAAANPPTVQLKLHAPGLALKTLLTALDAQPLATGNLEVDANLSGTGASPHAIASSLDGTMGLAVAGGTLDNRVMGSVLGRVLAAINVLDLVGKGGTSELRCFAARIDAHNGVATVNPLALSSSLLTMTGDGSANLGSETLDLGLKPQVKLAATSLVIPVKVTGPMRNPSASVDKLATATSNAGTVAGTVVGTATGLGIVGGLLGVDKALGLASGDPCPAALAAARGQPAPAQATTGGAAKYVPSLDNPGAALKSLFR